MISQAGLYPHAIKGGNLNRREAQEQLTLAVADAYRTGCTQQDIQDSMEFGARDAGKLRQASMIADGHVGPCGYIK